jgi:hypothetical protein
MIHDLMNTKQNLVEVLKPQYFWDVDPLKLDGSVNKRLIIERIFTLGSLNEIKTVVQYYGLNQTISILRKITWLDPKTLNFISKIYNIPKRNFKCHTRKSLMPQHWTF